LKYHEILSELIKKSGKNLKNIANECQGRGIRVDASYISKLQTAKKPPASDRLNRILAEVLGGDPEALVVAAYREKIPTEILEKLATGTTG